MLDNVHTHPVRHAGLKQWGKVHESFFRPIASAAKDLKSPLAIPRRFQVPHHNLQEGALSRNRHRHQAS